MKTQGEKRSASQPISEVWIGCTLFTSSWTSHASHSQSQQGKTISSAICQQISASISISITSAYLCTGKLAARQSQNPLFLYVLVNNLVNRKKNAPLGPQADPPPLRITHNPGPPEDPIRTHKNTRHQKGDRATMSVTAMLNSDVIHPKWRPQ